MSAPVRKVDVYLRHPVTKERYRFVITDEASRQQYLKYKKDWERPLPSQAQQESNAEVAASGEHLRRSAPALAATAASMLVPESLPYAWLARPAASATAAFQTAPIAGADPMAEARNQLLMGLAAEPLAGLAGMAGRGLMRKGVSASPELKQSFGDIGGAMAKERIGVGNLQTLEHGPETAGLGEKLLGNFGPRTGQYEAARRLGQVQQQVERVLVRDKTTHSMPALLAEVRANVMRRYGRLTQRADKVAAMDDVLKGMQNENPATLDNQQLWELKRGAQDEAINLLKIKNNPLASNAEAAAKAGVEQEVKAEFQKVANARLHKIPGYTAPATRFRQLEGIRRATADAEVGNDATAGARAVMGENTASRVAFNPQGALSPQAFTTLGRSLDHPVTLAALRNLPRSIQEGQRIGSGDPTVDYVNWLKWKMGGGQ